MSNFWTPHVELESLLDWYDGNDPHANNRQTAPEIDRPSTLSDVTVWGYDGKTRWTNKVDTSITAPSTQTFSDTWPRLLNNTIKTLAITSAGNGVNYLGGLGNSYIGTAPLINLATANAGTSSGQGNLSDPDRATASFQLASSQITSMIGVLGGQNYTVGDTVYPNLGAGQQGAVLTVTELYKKNALYFVKEIESDKKTNSATRMRIFLVCTPSTHNGADNPIIQFFDSASSFISVGFDLDAGAVPPFTNENVQVKVQYKATDGSTVVSNGLTAPITKRLLIEVVVDTSSPYVSEFINGNLTDSSATTSSALAMPSSYAIKFNADAGGTVGVNEICEVIVVDETNKVTSDDIRKKYHGYLAHKWEFDLAGGHTYASSAPTLDDADYFSGSHKLNPREPLQVVKLWLDCCDNTYGEVSSGTTSTCTASGSTGGECYNTKFSCQALATYRTSMIGKKPYVFSQEVGKTLAGIEPNSNPCIMSVTSAPAEIQPTSGVAVRSNITIKLRDFYSSGSDADKYYQTRGQANIIAIEQGSYFEKLLARNPHYYGRTVEVFDGFFGDDGTAHLHHGKKEYIIDSMTLDNGVCTIKCKDPLSFADELKSKVPTPTKFSLGATLSNGSSNTNVALKFDNVDIAGSNTSNRALVEDYFGADNTTGFVRIEEEILGYRVDLSSGNAGLDFYQRDQWGTVKEGTDPYEVDVAIQKCLPFGTYNNSGSGSTINDAVYEILVNNAGVPANLINNISGDEYSWADEKNLWLSAFKINTIISEPESANKLVADLASSVGVNFFWSDLAAKIIMRAETPEAVGVNIPLITDNDVVEDSLKVINSEKDRVSRVYYYYNQRDLTSDRKKPKNYKSLFVNIDSDSELPDEYGREASKTLYNWGISSSVPATSVTQRLLNRFKNVPKTVQFALDVSSKQIKTGEHFFLKTKNITSLNGISLQLEMQCLSSKYDSKNQQYIIKGKQFRFATSNTCTITPNIFIIVGGAGAGANYAVGETLTFGAGSNSATGIQIRVDSIGSSGEVTGATLVAKGDLNTASKYAVGDILNYASGSTSGSGLQIQINQEFFKGDGAGTGTEDDAYTGVRATGGYLADSSDNLMSDNASQPYLIL